MLWRYLDLHGLVKGVDAGLERVVKRCTDPLRELLASEKAVVILHVELPKAVDTRAEGCRKRLQWSPRSRQSRAFGSGSTRERL